MNSDRWVGIGILGGIALTLWGLSKAPKPVIVQGDAPPEVPPRSTQPASDSEKTGAAPVIDVPFRTIS